MRASRYNSSLTLDNGEHLLFNSANGMCVALSPDAWGAYLSALTEGDSGDAASLTYAHAPTEADAQSIIVTLSELGFLTQLSAEDELSFIQLAYDTERAQEDTLELVIAPTYACNYRCPYCYETDFTKRHGVMSGEVIDKLCDFVVERWDATHYQHLSVEWYGGDPSLVLDRVEDISQRLIDFCDRHDIAYSAMMLTNCNLIDQKAVDTLVRCKVEEVFITVDGPEEIHNARRVAADGSNSFQKQIEAARLLIAAGIHVNAYMNADRVSLPYYREISNYLRDELGVELSLGILTDCGHTFGTGNFKKPAFDLFTHEEYAYVSHDLFTQKPFTARDIQAMLQPVPWFCRGQHDAYFVIDAKGDVSKCDGYMGHPEYVLFNLLEGYTATDLHQTIFDATHDEKCSACNILPICQGNCIWERRETDMPCHPLRYTLNDYLRDWRSCFGEMDKSGIMFLNV